MARPQLGPAPTRPADALRAQDLPAVLTRALGILTAGFAARSAYPCRIVGTGSSTMAGSNATAAARRFFNLLIGYAQVSYPSGSGTEAATVASTSASFGTPSTTAGVYGYNAGEGGTTAANYLTAAERTSIAALNPRAIIHMVGSNDYANGVDPATYKANVLASVSDLKSKLTVPCVQILVQPYQRMDVASPAYPWASYGQALAEIAAADPDTVAYLDISGPYRLVGIPGANPLKILDTDNVHQTDAGHALMADLLRDALRIPAAAATVTGGGTTYVADTFTRSSDGALSGSSTTTGAKTWTSRVAGQNGTAGTNLVTTQAGVVGPSSALTTPEFHYVDIGASDYTVEATVAALGAAASARGGGPAVRCGVDGSGYFVNTRVDNGTQGWSIYSYTATAGPTLVTSTTTAIPAVGDRVRVVTSGTTITVFVNGAQILQVTSASLNSTSVLAGLVFNGTGTATRLDDFARTA